MLEGYIVGRLMSTKSMTKKEKKEMVGKVIVVGKMAKATGFIQETDTIDFMVIAALEKLDMPTKKAEKLYMKG